ncbi:MAG: hypothetical protein IJM36_05605 [Acholeplasmatales bacterium]|nr:hypothetical protein [Acholeplasmatales bacterium]
MSELNIVLYGDSNTYGYSPEGPRYVNRYGQILKQSLGYNYKVFEEGVVGRTTIYDDYREGRKGIDTIDNELSKYHKIDLLVVMLGTNDYKIKNARLHSELEYGMNALVDKIKSFRNIDKVLLVSPILLADNIETLDPEFDHHSYNLSINASNIYKSIAKRNKLLFFDAKTVAYAGIDGEHLTEDSHISLGNALANFIIDNV